MAISRRIAVCAVLALFIHGCGGTDSGRTANHSDLSAPTATDANSDFTYPKNPFYVQVGPGTGGETRGILDW